MDDNGRAGPTASSAGLEPVRLSRPFFARDALAVAMDLLGRVLVSEVAAGTVAGRIVEVEAYCGIDDPASHGYRGQTRRNAVMFGPPGHLYVYFTYGMHHCANVVAETDGVAGAVLLRAVEPVLGLDLMAARRGTEDPRLLARGPARLCQAFGLDLRHNGSDLTHGPIWIGSPQQLNGAILSSTRIGLTAGLDHPWRFFEKGPWVSVGLGPGRNRAPAAASPEESEPGSPPS